MKYYIYVCKFRGTKPTFIGYTTYIKSNKETEYYIAKKRGKLSNHFKKWRFDLKFSFFAIPFHFMGEYNVCFPLLLDCVFCICIVYRSDSVTLNMISCDNCCKIFMFAAIVISCDFC